MDKGGFGNRRFPFAVIALFVFICFSCARQGLPPGGPEDKEPPKLVNSIPAAMSTGVSVSEPVVIEFSEAMDETSVEDNVFIVPIPAVWPEFSWSGKNRIFIISPKEPLRDNTTYVISIGAKARDLQRNQMNDTLTITFSTGETIENGKITGSIIPYNYFGEEPESVSGIDVIAYRLNGSQSSPDPRYDVPDYFTQSGSDGSYEMTGLSRAEYRIFAVGDRDGDGFYSEGSDMIGIAQRDITFAADDSVSAPSITISGTDTTSVQLRSVRVPDPGRVEVFFDRDIISSGLQIGFTGLDITGWFVDSENAAMVSVATAPQENGKKYSIDTLKVFDADGNMIAPLGFTPDFTGVDYPDTSSLEIVNHVSEILLPDSGPVKLVFNRVLDLPGIPGEAFALKDAEGEDLLITRTGTNELEISPDGKWKEGYNYAVTLDSEAVRGVVGNTLTESGSELSFRVAPSDTLGFIKGTVEDPHGTDDSAYYLFFKHLESGTISEIEVKGNYNWSSGGVLPGGYISYAYRDDDGDGELFRGTINPYRASEPVTVNPDTLSVSSRWTVEDVKFEFKRVSEQESKRERE